MHEQPSDLPATRVREAVRRGWRVDVQQVEYAALGAGSHHWIAFDGTGRRRWFVTADRLNPPGGQRTHPWMPILRGAYETAASLRADGLEFVVAPMPDLDGAVVREDPPGWALAITPYIEGDSAGHGAWTDQTDRVAMAKLIARLHSHEPPASIPRWDLRVPNRAIIDECRHQLAQPWTTGPYAEPLRCLLNSAMNDIQTLLDSFDRLVDDVVAAPDPWVVTHGEPHSANVLRTPDGALLLIDWDTVRLAPKERDLATVIGDDPAALNAYRDITGWGTMSPAATELYRLWWRLAETCAYVTHLYRPHNADAETSMAWHDLHNYLPSTRQP